MPKASVKRLIECKKNQLIDLVLDIEKYPEFVPFCLDAHVYEKNKEGNLTLIIADLTIGKGPFKDTYKSDVKFDKKDNSIKVINIGYRFSEHQPWVIKNLNFELGAGEVMGITGPSGCGKSTLLGIIQSLIKSQEGEIEIDGLPLSIVGAQSLRWYSSSVLQEDVLFSGTIKSNISFNTAFVNMERVREVAKIAAIDQDITNLPLGYDSQIGEMGTVLSAGQQQRVLIARALYQQPKILLLDEGTAHLDKQTEAVVMQNIKALGISCIFVSHNQKLMSLADKILVMEKDGYKLEQVRTTVNV